MKILIVDDERSIRNSLKEILSDEGYDVDVAEDGAQDIGYCLALCAWLREVTPHCRLMLMCPEGQPEAVSRAIEAKRRGEIDDFVFYDVSLDYLAASLQSL